MENTQTSSDIPGGKHLLSTNDDYIAAFTALYRGDKPTFFTVAGPLPKIGRTDTALAATPNLTVILKCYAASGENTLHAHTTEDHVFIVLQGEVNFYGPNDEVRTFGPMHGVMLPAGSFYRFRASEGEPLVMLRIGCAAQEGGNMFARIGIDGKQMDGNSAENKHVEPVLSGLSFGPSRENA
ncbi:MAG: cupin domain-containing protein [Pigmentiphaga sp.]|uniref:cupin domain-containing protein n=1 Tax=Pigmentiphaga sp. TaxID=1977564 RepID=UPI0029B913E3|nr:cupin domain-containing protein [Pigmentiphaga sp.]MDX3905962.1 cupin domain-containing protein [Pigmentiphaga sp.]